MKKLFVSIFALAAFAACQSDFSDVNLDAPQQGGNANVGGSHTLYAEVGVVGEEDTKATYDEELNATWEEKDQIALLQEHANYGATFDVVNKLNIKEGWGTSKALFNGEISVDTNAPRVYHIAYPASAVEFTTTSSMSVEGVSYESHQTGMHKLSATGYGKYTYSSTLNITVPTTQSGKWEPYMYASTSEAVNSEAIGAKVLTTLTGAIAVRAFEPDGTTPKQLKQITITSSSAALAGAFTGTATSVGNTVTVTGDKSAPWVLWEEDSAKAEALGYLTTALQGYEATSTTVTKAMSLSFVGGEKSITVTGLENIPMDSDGYYTYYINVAPATLAAETLTIGATDVDGSTLKRVVDKEVVIAASHRAGFKLTWEEASLIPGTIESWYDNWNTSSFELAGSTIYARNIGVQGVPAEHVLALGVEIDGTLHADSAQAGVLSRDELKIEDVSNGTYSICTYAKVLLNGYEKELRGDAQSITVTSIPTATYNVYSSYSHNGDKALRNDVYGNELHAKVDLSDAYIQTNFVKSATFTYGGTNQALTIGSEWETTVGYGAHSTSITVVLQNGYTLSSGNYTTHVTGIPFTMTTSSNADGWSTSGTVKWNTDGGVRMGKNQTDGKAAYITKSFHIPADITVKVTASGTVDVMAGQKNTATLSVGSSSVVSQSITAKWTEWEGKSTSFSCSSATATMTSSSNTVKCNSSYTYSDSYVVLKAMSIVY